MQHKTHKQATLKSNKATPHRMPEVWSSCPTLYTQGSMRIFLPHPPPPSSKARMVDLGYHAVQVRVDAMDATAVALWSVAPTCDLRNSLSGGDKDAEVAEDMCSRPYSHRNQPNTPL